jgi:Trypsin-co-occurring domain 2
MAFGCSAVLSSDAVDRWFAGSACRPDDALVWEVTLMADKSVGLHDGVGLADAIGLLRDELLKARAAGTDSDIQLPVESMTVVLTVEATRSLEGKAGFKVPVVELELGGGGSRQHSSGQTVTVVFGEPVDRQGRPVKVARASGRPKE